MAGNKRVTKNSRKPDEDRTRLIEIGIHGILLTIAGLLLFLSLVSFDQHDVHMRMGDESISNLMGAFGVRLAWMFLEVFGVLSYPIAIGLVYLGVRAVMRRPLTASPMRIAAPFIAVVCTAVLLHMGLGTSRIFDDQYAVGGRLGSMVGELTTVLIQRTGTVIVAFVGLAMSVMYMCGLTLRAVFGAIGSGIRKAAAAAVNGVRESFRRRSEERRARKNDAGSLPPDTEISVIRPSDVTPIPETRKGNRRADDDPAGTLTCPTRFDPAPPPEPPDDLQPPPVVEVATGNENVEDIPDEDIILEPLIDDATGSGPRIVLNKRGKASFAEDQMIPGMARGPWEPPPLSLLDYDDPGQQEIDQAWLKQNADRLTNKLLDYKVQGVVKKIHPGPVVTMYEFLPAAGVKIAQIANLADDLTMALEALSIRIVAPIPGRGVVGIEVPNKVRETVYLREILASEEFSKSRSKLTIALGKDIFGNPVVTDLARMPHLLIAGATGSGKSVAVNAFILSLLRNASPDEVRLILVDPKVVELQVYENIPHLLLPVVYDPKHAAAALRWAVEEMERRYSLLARLSARNITSYNQRIERIAGIKAGLTTADSDDEMETGFAPDPNEFDAEDLVKLPYIVIVLDEFADLMMVASKDVETAVARLAQKARAAGIHLIMATQRPSKEVITGLIKANFPARMAFRVSSSIDSRIILDQRGADALLGYGDMLFLKPGQGSLERVHGSFVSDDEVSRFVAHLKSQGTPDYQMEIIQSAEEDEEIDEGENDKYTEDAQAIVLESGRASISYLQRQLKIGYNRAARIMEILEKRRVVGPPDSRGERQILK